MDATGRGEATPLDAQTAGTALLAGLKLAWVHYTGGRPSSFSEASPAVLGALRNEPSERPVVVAEHRCPPKATGGPLKLSWKAGEGEGPKEPHSPSAAPSRPSSGPSTGEPTALTAATSRSEVSGPRCSGCGQPCADGTYAAIELGDVLVWASHVDACP